MTLVIKGNYIDKQNKEKTKQNKKLRKSKKFRRK